jgi:hypothetical protein
MVRPLSHWRTTLKFVLSLRPTLQLHVPSNLRSCCLLPLCYANIVLEREDEVCTATRGRAVRFQQAISQQQNLRHNQLISQLYIGVVCSHIGLFIDTHIRSQRNG